MIADILLIPDIMGTILQYLDKCDMVKLMRLNKTYHAVVSPFILIFRQHFISVLKNIIIGYIKKTHNNGRLSTGESLTLKLHTNMNGINSDLYDKLIYPYNLSYINKIHSYIVKLLYPELEITDQHLNANVRGPIYIYLYLMGKNPTGMISENDRISCGRLSYNPQDIETVINAL